MADEPGFIIKEFGPRCLGLGLESTVRYCIDALNNHLSVEGTREIQAELLEHPGIYQGLIVIYPLEGLITAVYTGGTGGPDNKILRSATPQGVDFCYNHFEYRIYFSPKEKP